ncbi:MAG TPA: tetratricopeptide repeat protein [Thermoanaerobaculaceae bacterium]|nr:tetratricopeptide repeat protein [Acidobacteriota bacterium]NLH10524.1 tetratricopeptide repeat protein [Holophagae bacterium]HPW56949.1 tetratricopeptide repeat protein [Thermoanaerobaculaceae bacterium]
MRRILTGGAVLAVVLAGCVSSRAPAQPASGPVAPPEDPVVLVAQGQLRLTDGEISEGLRLLRRAYELDPQSSELGEELGLALMNVGISDDALRVLRALTERSPAGEAALGILLAQTAASREDVGAAVEHLRAGVDTVPLGPQARLMLAQSLVRLEKGEEASAEIARLQEIRPDDPRLYLLAGQALRLQGKNAEAAEAFRKATAAPETRTRATLELIDALSASGQLKEAAELMGSFLREGGATLQALTRWAALLARSGDKAKAIEVLDEVLEKDPAFREGVLLKALFETADNRFASAEQLYRRAIALDADDLDAKMGLARLLFDLRRLDEARTLFLEVWEQASDRADTPREALVDLARDLAALELVARRPEAARRWLERGGGESLGRRALALWSEYFRQRKAWSEGLAWLSMAKLEDNPELVRMRTSAQAEFLLGSGLEPAANAVLGTLLEGDEDDVLAALGALQRRRMYARSAAAAAQALGRFPDSHEIRFDLAAALERSGRWEAAVEQFRTLLAAQPDSAAALNYLGYMFAERKVNLEEAKTMLLKAVEQEPSSGAYLDSLGWVYFQLGALDLAEKYLLEAVGFEPSDATLHEHLGDLWVALEQLDRAAEAYRKALTLELEEPGQQERIETKLQALGANPAP